MTSALHGSAINAYQDINKPSSIILFFGIQDGFQDCFYITFLNQRGKFLLFIVNAYANVARPAVLVLLLASKISNDISAAA
ncbi:hypothetical protein D3C73_1167630 [compost metagenome]